jgi:hypothetical protein
MPASAQWFITAAAVVTAIGLLIKKVIIPGYKGVGALEDALPVFREFTATFKGKTDVFKVIEEIAQQFRTDSGSSLRDAVDQLGRYAERNRLSAEKAAEVANQAAAVAEQAAEDNRRSNEQLMIRFEAQRQLDEQRSEQQERLVLKVDRAAVKLDQMMHDRAQVATDLTAREKKVDAASGGVASDLTERQRLIDEASSGVASDLAASRQRADDTPAGETAGTAADAASQTPKLPEDDET